MKTDPAPPLRARLVGALAVLTLVLAASVVVALVSGRQRIDWRLVLSDPFARTLFFRLRLPRVLMGLLIGASLSLVGACLQALFRNPLADPFTLGVSGGGVLGASVAIALGWGARVFAVPVVFLAAFAGSAAAIVLVYRIARSGATVMPGSLLLAGVVLNLTAGAGVLTIQYLADQTRALQILRWMIGSLDAVGFQTIDQMLIFLVPGWLVLLAFSRDLHLLAMDEDTAASLGVNVRRCEIVIYTASSLVVGVTVAVGGTIGFVGLIVPHIVRLLFGQDVRIVMPCSFLLGAAFLMLADAVARTALGQSELPVGAVTGILGGPFFLWLMRREQRYSAM